MIKEFISKVKNKEIDPIENTHKILEKIKKINKEYHYFNEISEELALELAKKAKQNPKGKLAGLPVSVKDCICVKDVESRSGSKILSGYKPSFNATAIQKIIDEGGIIIGKTSQDEFGFGGFSANMGIGFEKPLNPFDKTRACGGSSGGSAGITQMLDEHISLGESTGGSIVNPAAFCGVVGLCSTYGRVSRYGLIDYANSLDKIGPIGKKVEDVALALEIISGFDNKESTSANVPVDDYSNYVGKEIKGMNIGLIKESISEGVDQAVKDRFMDSVLMLESNGAKVKEVSLPLSKYGLAVYYLIATSEASTNLAKYCGIRYGQHDELKGNFNEYFTKVRSENLGEEAKRRIILGTFARMSGFRDAFYLKAAKVRTKIIEEYKKAFKKFDVLISPTVPILPIKFSEIEKLTLLQNYMIDVLTVSPNLAGLPHMNVPIGFKDKLPVGIMLIGNHFEEGKLMQVGAKLE